MTRTLHALHHYWGTLIAHLPQIQASSPSLEDAWSIVGIRLGYRPTGLLATYSIAPNTHHPRPGITTPQDITDIAVPFNSHTDNGLEWTLPLDREFYTPFGKVAIEGESGFLQDRVPQFRIHPL